MNLLCTSFNQLELPSLPSYFFLFLSHNPTTLNTMAQGYATRSKGVPPRKRPGREKSKSKTLPEPSAIASTSIKQDAEIEAQKLLLSMDYGTKTLSVAYRLVKPDEFPSPANIHDIHFSERDYFAPQAAAWTKDGSFIWGYVST